MSRKSKWIEIDSPTEPITDVARRALRHRLDSVWWALPPAAKDADEDIEYVHQLRVASRRAVAAMEIFADLLPNGRRHWFRKHLKKVRRAAGEARDLDVLILRLSKQDDDDDDSDLAADLTTQPHGPAGEAHGHHGANRSLPPGCSPGECGPLVEHLRQLRREAQRPIHHVYRRLLDRDYYRRVTKLLGKVRLRGAAAGEGKKRRQPTVAEAACQALAPIIEQFFATSQSGFADLDALHQFRIQGKQLRYAIEIFAGAFGPGMRRDVYPLVEELQEKLGEVNDHFSAAGRYRGWLAEMDDDAEGNNESDAQRKLLEKLVAHEDAALAAAHERFLAWWTPHRAGELQSRLHQLLGASAELSAAS